MVRITHVNVLKEDDNFIIYFQSDQGSCFFSIDESFSKQLQNALSEDESFVNQLIEDHNITIEKCELLWNGKSIISKIYTSQNVYESSFYQSLPIMVDLKIPIYMDKIFIDNDYRPNQEHENQVNQMIVEEQAYFNSYQIQKLLNDVYQAVEEERYEEAAILRDQIEALKNIPKNNE